MALAEAVRPAVPSSVGGEEISDTPKAWTPDDLKQFVRSHPELRVELTTEGELILMPATFRKTGLRNARLTTRLGIWCETTGLGYSFDSSTLFLLPDGSVRSPDACWVEKSRWEAVGEEDQDALTVLCPDFVAELRSKTDRLSVVQAKMREYIDNGAQLGWLIDPQSRRVEIYRPGQEVEILDNPASLSGEDVLLGFILNLKGIMD